jgi:hypothetical protein
VSYEYGTQNSKLKTQNLYELGVVSYEL